MATAHGYYQVLSGLAILGAGWGLLMPNANSWLAAETPEVIRGRTVGGLTTSIFLGQFFSPILSLAFISDYGIAVAYGFSGCILLSIAIGFITFSLKYGFLSAPQDPSLEKCRQEIAP